MALFPAGWEAFPLSGPAGVRENTAVYIGSLDLEVNQRLLDTNLNVEFAPPRNGRPGYVFYWRDGILMARPFDHKRLTFRGEAIPAADQVGSDVHFSRVFFSVSNTVLAYGRSRERQRQLLWVDRRGKGSAAVGPPGCNRPALSSDGRLLALDRVDPPTKSSDIWLIDCRRGSMSRFTFDPWEDYNPLWSPDGSRLIFSSNRKNSFDMYVKGSAAGDSAEHALLESAYPKSPEDWSRDGRFILYMHEIPLGARGNRDLWILPTFGDRKPFPFLQTSFDECQGRFSPDGRWIAYTSNESGRLEVYVRDFPGSSSPPAHKWQISTSGGAQPKWRGDGRELFYLSADGKLMGVRVDPGPRFRAGIPEALFEVRVGELADARNYYEVTADGQRFLINSTMGPSSTAPITVVVNWAAKEASLFTALHRE